MQVSLPNGALSVGVVVCEVVSVDVRDVVAVVVRVVDVVALVVRLVVSDVVCVEVSDDVGVEVPVAVSVVVAVDVGDVDRVEVCDVVGVDSAHVSKDPSTNDETAWLRTATVVSQSTSSFNAPPMEHVSDVCNEGRYTFSIRRMPAEVAAHAVSSSSTDTEPTTEPQATSAANPQALRALSTYTS